MSAKFTPGPWEYRRDKETDRHYVGCGIYCIVNDAFATRETKNCGQVEREANARLIAAAPELYEALKQLVEQYGLMPDGPLGRGLTNGAFLDARAALQKADGGDQPR